MVRQVFEKKTLKRTKQPNLMIFQDIFCVKNFFIETLDFPYIKAYLSQRCLPLFTILKVIFTFP